MGMSDWFGGGSNASASGGSSGFGFIGDWLGGSAESAHQARLTRSRASKEAQEQRDWTERMSNTALQRKRADAEKAGVNPVLAMMDGSGANVGAGASGASSAQGEVHKFDFAQKMANIANAKALKAQTELTESQKAKVDKETEILSPKGSINKDVDNIYNSIKGKIFNNNKQKTPKLTKTQKANKRHKEILERHKKLRKASK